MKLWRFLSLGALGLLVLTGCQTGKPHVSNATFMSLWTAYDQCQSSQDLDAMQLDLRRLQEGSQTALSTKSDPLRPFLRPIENWIAPQAPRLAADPKAMAAACTLHTARAAAASGHTHLAEELLTSVINNYPQPIYGYYVAQARLGLTQLTGDFAQVSLRSVSTPLTLQ